MTNQQNNNKLIFTKIRGWHVGANTYKKTENIRNSLVYTDAEDRSIVLAIVKNVSIEEIAKDHDRKISGIFSRISTYLDRYWVISSLFPGENIPQYISIIRQYKKKIGKVLRDEVTKEYPRQYKAWSRTERNRLIALVKNFTPLLELSQIFERKPSTIFHKIAYITITNNEYQNIMKFYRQEHSNRP